MPELSALGTSTKMAEKFNANKHYYGKPCSRGHGSLRYKANHNCVMCAREKSRLWMRRHPKASRERNNKACAGYRARNPDQHTRRWFRNRGYPEELGVRPDRCDCCGQPPTNGKGKVVHLDHDHETGAFRGWLCHGCNTGIGLLGDNVEGLERAIRYLRREAK